MWRKAVESLLRFVKVDGIFLVEKVETGVMLLVNSFLPYYSKEADLKQNNGILQWMQIGPIAFFVANS